MDPNAVKDLYRRAEVYHGNVQTRRGAEVRAGTHAAILTEEEYRGAVAGVESRKRHKGKRPPTSKLLYLLRGLVYCSCGTRMHGDAARSRGQLWRYYLCPVSEGRRAAETRTATSCPATRSESRPTWRSGWSCPGSAS